VSDKFRVGQIPPSDFLGECLRQAVPFKMHWVRYVRSSLPLSQVSPILMHIGSIATPYGTVPDAVLRK